LSVLHGADLKVGCCVFPPLFFPAFSSPSIALLFIAACVL
jgi:hypothetical protein